MAWRKVPQRMDRLTLKDNTNFDGDEPSCHKTSGNPQSQLEIEILEDAGIKQEDRIFGERDRHCIDGFVYIAACLSVSVFRCQRVSPAYKDLNQYDARAIRF